MKLFQQTEIDASGFYPEASTLSRGVFFNLRKVGRKLYLKRLDNYRNMRLSYGYMGIGNRKTGNGTGEEVMGHISFGEIVRILCVKKTIFSGAILNREKDILELRAAEMDSTGNTADCIFTYLFRGEYFSECFHRFATHTIFDGLNLYEAEQEIEVVFG